jgi:hypothetical protein
MILVPYGLHYWQPLLHGLRCLQPGCSANSWRIYLSLCVN